MGVYTIVTEDKYTVKETMSDGSKETVECKKIKNLDFNSYEYAAEAFFKAVGAFEYDSANSPGHSYKVDLVRNYNMETVMTWKK